MEQIVECVDECCDMANENVKESYMPVDSCSEHEMMYSGVPEDIRAFDSDEKLHQSHMQHSKFVPPVDGDDAFVYDSCKSPICSSADVFSDSIHLHADDNITCGEQLMTTVTKDDDSNVCNLDHSNSVLTDYNQRQSDMSNTTFLSRKRDVSASVSRLSLLASRVKALCNIWTATTRIDENKIFTMALHSTNLQQLYRRHPYGPGNACHCDLVVADICISHGEGHTMKLAKHCACSNAIELLQKPYLHLETSSPSDSMMRLVGLDNALIEESYDTVTQIDINSSDLCFPVLDVVDNSKLKMATTKMTQKVVRFKRLISMVRTILHVLQTVKSNKRVIHMAARYAEMSISLHTDGKHPVSCRLSVDGVLVALSEAATKNKIKDNVYTEAVKILCKPYLRLDGSEHGSCVKLVGSDQPFDEMPSSTLATQQNDKCDEGGSERTQFVAEEMLPCCDSEKSVLPATKDSAAMFEGSMNKPSPAALLSTVDFPAIMGCFRRLSKKVKSLVENTATLTSDATIMASALKATKLPFHARVVALDEGRGYRCELRIVFVFVASGEAARKVDATGRAYMYAAELLQKPYFRLAADPGSSTVLIGSDKPFAEVASALEPQQPPEIRVSSPATVDRRAEKVNSGTLTSCTLLSNTDKNEKCVFADATAAEVPMSVEKTLMRADSSDVDIAGNKPNVEIPRVDDAVHEHELTEDRKTVVIARSHKDLSRLVNRFDTLAHFTKDVHAMFKGTKSIKHVFEMALHMSHMYSKSEIVKLENGCARCQLLIDSVLVAVAEDSDKKSAKIMAFNTAAELLHMSYLCLEEEHDAVRLLGSDEPFIDMTLEPDTVRVNSSSSRGFWLDNSFATARAGVKKDLHKPMNALPYTADLSVLINRFHRLACRVKAVCKSALKVNNGIDIIQRATSGSKMCVRQPTVHVRGVKGFECEVVIDGVRIACGQANTKKQVKHAAYNAAVELLKKPYLRLQEDPERNQSFILIGSEQPFLGGSAGVLPYQQNCVVNEKGKFVEVDKSVGPGDSAASDKRHSPDAEHDTGKLKPETCSEQSSNLPRASSIFPADEKVLFQSQISVLTYSMDISELVNQFGAVSHRVKSICGSSMEDLSGSDVIKMALADTQMLNKRLITWMNSTAFRCQFSVDGIVLAHGEGDSKEEAKQAAYNAAVELLNKPYLQLQENSEFKRYYRLVGSDKPFVTVSSNVFPSRQNIVTDKRCDLEKRFLGHQHLVIDKNSGSCADKNESTSQLQIETLPAHNLTDFVILRNCCKKRNMASMNILQQSAEFNKWKLLYDLSEVEEGCRCHLTLGSHIVGNAVRRGKASAKTAAADQALKQLTSTCYTLQVKKFDALENALTRDEVWIIIDWWS